MEKELWKQIPECNYEISTHGRLRNMRNGRILRPNIDRYGYFKICYIDNSGALLHKTIHRLVAQAWIDNPLNKHPYTKEDILNSEKGYVTSTHVYEVTYNGKSIIVHGKKRLCECLDYRPDKLLSNITLEEIIQSSNIPNLSVRRLNEPISVNILRC